MYRYIEIILIAAATAYIAFVPMAPPADYRAEYGMRHWQAGFDRSLDDAHLCATVKAMAAQVPGAVAHCN